MYGCTTWGNMLKNEQIQKLQKLQNKCLYYITNKKVNVSIYQELKILRIPSIIKLLQSAAFTTPQTDIGSLYGRQQKRDPGKKTPLQH